MKTKKKIIIAIFILILIALINYDPPQFRGVTNVPMSNLFVGTYVCDTNSNCYISAFSRDNTFFYSDSDQDIYLKGVFKMSTDDKFKYTLSGNKVDSQNITCTDLTFSFVLNDTTLTFKKISEIPITTLDIEKLSE